MTQQALALTLPGSDQRERIQREVRRILEGHAGGDRAIHRGTLARLVRENLGLHQLAQATLDRRVRESVAGLLDEGVRVVCSGSGVFLAETEEDIREGDRALAGNAFGALRRLATYRRVTLPALLAALGQTALELESPSSGRLRSEGRAVEEAEPPPQPQHRDRAGGGVLSPPEGRQAQVPTSAGQQSLGVGE